MSFRTFRYYKFFTVFCALCSLIAVFSLHAGQVSSEEDIHHQATIFLNQYLENILQDYVDTTISISVHPLKKKPELCHQALTFSRRSEHRLPIGTVRLNVVCPGQWKKYISADVNVQLPVVHLRKSLTRGDILTDESLQLVDVSFDKLRGTFFQDLEKLSGRQLRRSLSVGSIVSSNELLPNYLVHKGQIVTIQSGHGSLFVSMSGIALESGFLSETIRVRNRSSGNVLDAKVVAKNKVQIGR